MTDIWKNNTFLYYKFINARVYWTVPGSSAFLLRGTTSVISCLHLRVTKPFQNGINTYWKEFAEVGANSFPSS